MTTILGGALVVRDLALLPAAVASLRPHVDRLLIGVDDRADPAVTEWVRASGVDWYAFRFTGFGAAFNEAGDRLGCRFVYHLDADESIDPLAGALLRPLVDRAIRLGLDAYRTPRRHWLDLARTREHRAPWPDWQVKLRRRTARYRWRVHQEIEPAAWVATDWGPVTEHFNFCLRGPGDWARVNAEYAALLRADVAAGRVWTGDPAALEA